MSEKKALRIKEKKRRKLEKKRAKKAEAAARKKSGEKKKRSLSETLEAIGFIKELVLEVVKKFFRYLRVDLARFKIKVATSDAATTALAYGAIQSAVTLILPALESLKGFSAPRDGDLSIEADYLSEDIQADIKISLSIRVWQVISVALTALKKYLSRSVKKKIQQEK